VIIRAGMMRAVLSCAAVALLSASATRAQAPAPSFQDLRIELDAKAAAAGATTTSIDCRQNLRERVCVADIVDKAGTRDVLVVSRPFAWSGSGAPVSSALTPAREASLGLAARPLFAQRTQILDVASSPDRRRLIVLEPAAVAIRQWTSGGDVSDVVESRPIQTLRARPRDMRGRVNAAQVPFEVFLPGVTCRGDLDPLRVSCADETAPWPGLANGGVEASRNYFTTPEGRTFSSAAPLSADAPARWLLADPQGALSLLDDRRSIVAKLSTTGDDVAPAHPACSPGAFVVVSNRAPHEADVDELRLFRVSGRELVAAASPLRLPGILTAFWDSTAVVHDAAAGRYEAFQISVSCAR